MNLFIVGRLGGGWSGPGVASRAQRDVSENCEALVEKSWDGLSLRRSNDLLALHWVRFDWSPVSVLPPDAEPLSGSPRTDTVHAV